MIKNKVVKETWGNKGPFVIRLYDLSKTEFACGMISYDYRVRSTHLIERKISKFIFKILLKLLKV